LAWVSEGSNLAENHVAGGNSEATFLIYECLFLNSSSRFDIDHAVKIGYWLLNNAVYNQQPELWWDGRARTG
jgi:hypothetical protein